MIYVFICSKISSPEPTNYEDWINENYYQITLQIKIGFSKDQESLESRVLSYKTENAGNVLVYKILPDGTMQDEQAIHRYFKCYRSGAGREWYRFEKTILQFFKDKNSINDIIPVLIKEGCYGLENAKEKEVLMYAFAIYCSVYRDGYSDEEKAIKIEELVNFLKLAGVDDIETGIKELWPDQAAQILDLLQQSNNLDKESEKKFQEFIEEYYSFTLTDLKLKFYCEFRDENGDNLPLICRVHQIIEKTYFIVGYECSGTRGCSAKRYRLNNIKESIRESIMTSDPLKLAIFDEFKVGTIIPLKKAKLKMAEIFLRLNITRAPKASILNDYFTTAKTCIIDKVTKAKVNCIKLLDYK